MTEPIGEHRFVFELEGEDSTPSYYGIGPAKNAPLVVRAIRVDTVIHPEPDQASHSGVTEAHTCTLEVDTTSPTEQPLFRVNTLGNLERIFSALIGACATQDADYRQIGNNQYAIYDDLQELMLNVAVSPAKGREPSWSGYDYPFEIKGNGKGCAWLAFTNVRTGVAYRSLELSLTTRQISSLLAGYRSHRQMIIDTIRESRTDS